MIMDFKRWVEKIETKGAAGIKIEYEFDERFATLGIKLNKIEDDENEDKA